MRLILKLILMGISVWGISRLLPSIHFQEPSSAFIFVIVLALLNVFVKPILIIFTIPITILTLGIFLIFINAIIILFADYLMRGFDVDGFLWAFIFSLIISIVNSLIESIISPGTKR
jgi:putative membrane protein